ncbi:hypothetical protein, partial [Methylobacterium sp.]|uniref:hypothetical protein n=1 Tax=Methylobacterium sp. TaxID=409 RepID=UPI0025D17C6D
EITTMSRSGFFLSVSGPAAILTLLVHPTIRQTADQWTPAPAFVVSSTPVQATVPVEVASIPGAGTRTMPAIPSSGRTASDKDAPRMRKPLQEGCERSISSLAGPEARRMVPGRCMT